MSGDRDFWDFYETALQKQPKMTLTDFNVEWERECAKEQRDEDKKLREFRAMSDEEKLAAGYCVDLGPSAAGPPGWHDYRVRNTCDLCGKAREYVASDHPAGPGFVGQPCDCKKSQERLRNLAQWKYP